MRRCLLSALALGWLSAPATAATLQGYVRDAQGRATASAAVEVQAEPAGQMRTVLSDAKGFYRFVSLGTGQYKIQAHASSSDHAIYGPFRLAANENKTVDLVLKPALGSIEFSDHPTFVVAGVTESAYVGGYGSDATVRSAEALSKATASLRKQSAEAPSSVSQSEASLRAALSRDANNADLFHSLGGVEEKLSKPLEAVRSYQRAAELNASETNLFDWGTELLIHDAPQPASEVFEEGARLYPQSSRMVLGAAVAEYTRGDYAKAAMRFFAATDVDPADPGPYLFLAKVQASEITLTHEYLDRLARFAKLQPDNAAANYYYALALLNKKGQIDTRALARAQSLLEKVVRLDPAFAPAYLQLGILDSEKQDYAAAADAYQRAIRADPALEQAHYRLAAAYRATGDTEKAQRETEVFERLAKSSAQTRERERSELRRFVIDLKSPAAAH